MSLAEELGGADSEALNTLRIDDALRSYNVEDIVQYIRSSEHFEHFYICSRVVNEESGRLFSDAIVQSSHIRHLHIHLSMQPHFRGINGIRDRVAWIGSRNTLVNMTSLQSVDIFVDDEMSVLAFSALFPLLLTSTSLRKFGIWVCGPNGCSDDAMSALISYLGTASLREFIFETVRSSEAAFTALRNGVALSTVRQFTLCLDLLQELNLETVAESLARMIMESSLEEVRILPTAPTWSDSLISALKLTAPVRNMDFTFTQIGEDVTRIYYDLSEIGDDRAQFRINRKWKPLVFSANTPLALWPHILEKSHASPETSHGPADIVLYVLTQKPDLVPAP